MPKIAENLAPLGAMPEGPGAKFCEHCGAELGFDARFCGQCGAPVGRGASSTPNPHPATTAPLHASDGAADADTLPAPPSTSPAAPRRRWSERQLAVAGLVVAALVVAGAVGLAVSLEGGGGGGHSKTAATEARALPTTSTTSVAQGLAAHDYLVSIAARPVLDSAWSTYVAASNAANQALGDANASHNTAAAAAADNSFVTAVTNLINSVNAMQFPMAAEGDVRTLIATAGDLRGSYALFASEVRFASPALLPSAVATISNESQQFEQLNSAELLVRRDLTQILGG
jgi:hypothetical protein